MGIKIHQYPLERLVFGDDDYYDIDYWTGSSYETAKIKGSVIKTAIQAGIISENLFTTNNLNLPANREHYLTDKEFKFTINDVVNSIVGNARFGSAGLVGYLEDTAGATTTSYNFTGTDIILIADGTGNYTSLNISPGSIALSEGGTDISIDGTNTQLTAGNGTLQLGTVGSTNTWYTDNSVNKYGILLIGFGETSETNGTGANYTTLVDTSLVPKKYVDDLISGITSSSIYTDNGTIGTGRELTLTDTVRFKNGSFEIQGAGTSTGSTLALYDNDTTPYKRFEILDNGQFRLDSSNAVVATPVLIEMRPLGGTGTKPYFKIKNYGEVEILGGLSNLFNVQNTLGARQFEVLNGVTKINGSSQINSSFFQMLTDTQKISFNAGSGGALHHEIRTNGGGGPITTKFNIPGGGYQFIVGASAILGTEKISLQGDTLVDGSLDMNNNRILNSVVNPSVQETTSTATFTINADEETNGVLTAMSANTTIASPTGTPVQGQKLIYRFTDDGTSRTLTWNAIFRAIGITLPTATTASKLLYVGCLYNSTDSKWDVIAVKEEA